MRIEAIPSLSPRERDEVRAKCERNLYDPKWSEQATKILAELNAHESRMAHDEAAEFATYTDEERIFQAFRRIPLTETEAALVAVLHSNPRTWSKDLTRAMGWQGDSAWHMHFGMMCQRRGHLLWPAPIAEARKSREGGPATFWSGLLADYDEAVGWTLKAEAERAFGRLRVLPPAGA